MPSLISTLLYTMQIAVIQNGVYEGLLFSISDSGHLIYSRVHPIGDITYFLSLTLICFSLSPSLSLFNSLFHLVSFFRIWKAVTCINKFKLIVCHVKYARKKRQALVDTRKLYTLYFKQWGPGVWFVTFLFFCLNDTVLSQVNPIHYIHISNWFVALPNM